MMRLFFGSMSDTPPKPRSKAERPVQIDAIPSPDDHLEASTALPSSDTVVSSRSRGTLPDFSALTPDQVDAYRKGWSDGTTTFRNYLDGSIDALRHVIPAKDHYEAGAKILPFVLIAGAAATYGLAGLALRRNMFRRNAGLTARLDDLERRLALQIQANGRDQRIELDKLHKALSSIGQNRTQSGPVIRPDLGQGSLAVGGSLESRLRDLEDHVIMANKDRRTELYGLRSELMGELQVIKDEVKGLEGKIMGGLEEKLSAASGMRNAPRWELEEGDRECLEKKGMIADEEVNPSLEECDNRFDPHDPAPRTNGAPRHVINPTVSGSFTSANTPPPPKPRTYSEYAKDEELEASRQALYDNIQATKDKYQAIMDSAPANPAGTEASEMVDQLGEVANVIGGQHLKKKNKKKNKSRALTVEEDEEAQQTPSDFSPWMSSASSTPDPTKPASAQPGSFFEDAAELNESQKQGEDGQVEEKLSNPTSSRYHRSAPTYYGPRLGVDDSGNWRFAISPQPKLNLRAPGQRLADVVYEVKHAHHEVGSFYSFASSSSGAEYYSEVPVYLYPEFDIVRLDGQLWKCERTGPGHYIVKEKLSDSTSPEWDGVGFEKD